LVAGAGPILAQTTGHDLAAILFTSGSTGVPKGVEYQHRHFLAQVDLIRETYNIQPGEVDLPTFPLFALFDPALGMTTVIPKMDFTRPAKVDPVHLLEIAERFKATNMFGSPAVLDTVGRHMARTRKPRLKHLQRVISAGAPVPGPVMARFLAGLPEGAQVHTPYGATENLPVTSIGSDEILGETWARSEAGAGVCVGRPVAPNDVRIIRLTDAALPQWSDDLALPAGERGEITVQGPTTTEAYFGRPESTANAKIRMPDGQIRHRMGDVGWIDALGRLWFCGRTSHRVYPASGTSVGEAMDPVPCELPFNTHPAVRRCALVGVGPVGAQRPVICIEREPEAPGVAFEVLCKALREIALAHPHTQGIETFLDHGPLPVDIRHNAKINRPLVAQWASARLNAATAKGAP
jgi:acyl-CoA synthetase (AMP-forming)/AMP-acid ligase II